MRTEIKKRAGAVLLALVCAVSACVISAAAATETAPPVEAERLSGVFSFEYDRVFDGVYGSQSVYFQVPDYWKVNRAAVEVHVRLSPMLIDVPASLTVQLNGTPVDSVQLDYAQGVQQTIAVSLPVEELQQSYNSVTLTGFAQIYDEEGCLDEFSGANWVVIQADSFVQVDYDLREPTCQIAQYPYPLLSTADETGERMAVVIYEGASSDELTAAIWVRAGLSQHVQGEDRIQLIYYSQYEGSGQSAVVIAPYDQLPAEQKNALQAAGIAAEHLEDGAAIWMEALEGGGARMWITSRNTGCLPEAAQLLMDESRLSQEKGTMALVHLGSADALKNAADTAGDDIKLADWTGSGAGLEFRGSFRQEQTVYPAGTARYLLGQDDSMTFSFRYSENLDFNRSLFTVYVNGNPIASKKLERDRAAGDTLTCYIPEDLNGALLDSITFSFDLEIEDLYCTMRLDEMPWAYLSGDSTLTLTNSNRGGLSFEITPWPFVKAGLADHLLFVVPDNACKEELALLGQLASLYGMSMEPYGQMQAVYSSELDSRNAEGWNIILLGTYQNQPLLAQINGTLPFSISEDGQKFSGNSQFVFSDVYAETVGALELFPSCWGGENSAMLAAVAPNATGLSNLADYLAVLENRERLEGDAVLVDTGLEMRAFTFLDDGVAEEYPTLRQRLQQNKESVQFAIASTAAMGLMLLASVLILIRAREIRRKNGK